MTKRPGINERIGSLSSIREARSDSDKAGRMADQYRRVAGRNGATGDDARAARYSQRADVLDRIAKGNPQTKATGVDAGGAVAAARDLVARNDRDLAAAKPKAGKAASKTGLSALKGVQINAMLHDMNLPKSGTRAQKEGRIAKAMEGSSINRDTVDFYAKNHAAAQKTMAEVKATHAGAPGDARSAQWSQSMSAQPHVITTQPPHAASRSLDIEGRVRAGVDQRLASSSAPPYGLRIDPHAEAAGAAMTQAIADGKSAAEITAAGQKARAASESAARQAPAAPSRLERGLASITGHPVSRQSPPSVTNDAHMGTTSHAAPPPASPPSAPKEPMLSRLGNAYGKAQTGLTVMAAGAQGAHAYSDAREHGASVGAAAYEAMKAAAPSAALTVAHPVGSALANAGKAMTAHAAKILDGASALDSSIATAGAALDSPLLIAMTDTGLGVGLGMGGWASRGVGATLKAAGKVALPAAAAVGAYQGAKEDTNTVRGAGRGVVRSLDPTGIVTGLTGHGPGLAERVYDAAFGKAQARFKAAAAPADSQVAEGKRGWANPKVQAAAQAAKGRTFTGQE